MDNIRYDQNCPSKLSLITSAKGVCNVHTRWIEFNAHGARGRSRSSELMADREDSWQIKFNKVSSLLKRLMSRHSACKSLIC